MGDFSFLLTADHLENAGQPMNFSLSTTPSAAVGGTTVTGAYTDKSEKNQDRVVFGANSIDDTRQDQVKFKVAYDVTPDIKAAYTLGLWNFDTKNTVQSYIKDAADNTVYNGQVRFNGKRYDVTGMNPSEAEALHVMQALDVKSNTKGFLDWQLTLSDYDYQKDLNSASTSLADPYKNRIGRVVDMAGTGWTVFDARTTLRPLKHEIDIGYHIDHYELVSKTNNTADWSIGNKGQLSAASSGETRTQAFYVQDKWQITPQWALISGLRGEYWESIDGRNQATLGGAFKTTSYQNQAETKLSPKLSLSFEPNSSWGFRAAAGQAFRFPTVGELYQQLTQGSTLIQNNPDLKPEQVVSAELTAERRFASGLMRASLFNEEKYDALISQTAITGDAIPFGTGVCTAQTCSSIQNVGHIRTRGIELSTQWEDVLIHGLDLLANATLTHAKVLRNAADPSIEGKKPTRIPRTMFKGVASYHQGNNVVYSVAARYSGRQYNNLDNSDPTLILLVALASSLLWM